MARKQIALPRRPRHPQPRQTPYSRSPSFRAGGPLYPDPATPVEPQPVQWDEAQEVGHDPRPLYIHRLRTPCAEDPPTPGSIVSFDSISNLNEAISPSLTNISLAVEYQRSRTPFVGTPPSSEGSSPFVHYGNSSRLRESHEHTSHFHPHSPWHDNHYSTGTCKPARFHHLCRD